MYLVLTLTFTLLILPAAIMLPVSVTAQTDAQRHLLATELAQVKGVKILDTSDSAATIRWQRVKRATHYQVRVVDTAGSVVAQRKTKKRTTTFTDLQNATDYSVQVRAVRGQHKGAWSEAVVFSTKAAEESLYDQYKVVAGTFTGQWQNLTFGTSGDVTTVVEIDEDGRAAFTIDLGGLVFGLIDPDPKTYESTYDATGVVFTAQDDDLFGDLTITITVNDNDTANVVFTSTDNPNTGISGLNADGTLYADALDLDYQIIFSDESTADGIMNLTQESD